MLEDALVTAESEFSATEFPVSRITDGRTSKRWRSYRAPNLMLHGNCDSDDNPTLDDGYVDYWGTFERDETIKYGGISSWKHVKTSVAGGDSTSIYLQDATGTTDMHGLTAGTTYELSAQLRGGQGLSSANNAGLMVYEYSGGAWNQLGEILRPALNDWEHSRIKFTIPSASTGIRIRLFIVSAEEAGTAIWIDNVKLYVSADKIEYGDCESTDSPTLDGTPVSCVDGTWARSVAQKHGGSYSWLLTKTSAGGGGRAIQDLQGNTNSTDMHGLVAGSTYRFDAWLFTDAGTPENSKISLYEYYGGTWNETLIGNCSAAGVWQNKIKSITLSTATTGIRIQVVIWSAEAAGKLLYLDDLRVIPESRITIDLYDADAPQFAALKGHNLSDDATVYVQANTSADWASPPVSEEITVQELMLLFLANATAYRFWSFVFYDDDENEDGYIEIGWAALGDWLTCQTGPLVSRSREYDDKSVATELPSGAVIGMISTKLEGTDYETPPWTKENAAAFDAMYEEVRTVKPFVFLLTEDDLTAVEPLYARFEQPIERTHDQNTNRYSFKFRLKEAN